MRYTGRNTSLQMRRSSYITLFLFLSLLAGAVLLRNFSERFVFRYTDVYTKVVLWSLLLLTPFVLYYMKRFHVLVGELSKRYPTTWLRTWIVMPLLALMVVGLVLTGLLGWVFAAAAWSDGAVGHVSATAIKVGTYSRRKGCDQFATLRFATVDKETCLDTLYPHSSMQTGQLLDVGIKELQFGFLIVSIAATDSVSDVTNLIIAEGKK